MAEQELNPSDPPCLNLLAAFLAMEPTASLLALARVCGNGSVTETVQRFIWRHCITEASGKFHDPYLKNFLKKLISDAEVNSCPVLDEIYECYAHFMASLKDEFAGKEIPRVVKYISFLFPDEYSKLSSCPKSKKLVIPLQSSLNMLEGDTGCSVWPSSLYLSEFVLSFPELFFNKSCFEVGSGVGLVGICLAHVKASKVVLSDGDMSTLANMKFNLESNSLGVETDSKNATNDWNKVKCIYLPWESAEEDQLQSYKPDIILGADVIYDPLCLPHLVRLLKTLLKISGPNTSKDDTQGSSLGDDRTKNDTQGSSLGDNCTEDEFKTPEINLALRLGSRKGPVAIIASVIRNADTFDCFRDLVEAASLALTDITEIIKPVDLLPYMRSYNRLDIRLFMISYS